MVRELALETFQNLEVLVGGREIDDRDAPGQVAELLEELGLEPDTILTLPGEKWPNTPYIIMQLIVNEEVVYEREIPHTKMFRLPAGFKATRFRIRLRSNIHIQSVKLAETGKELSQF